MWAGPDCQLSGDTVSLTAPALFALVLLERHLAQPLLVAERPEPAGAATVGPLAVELGTIHHIPGLMPVRITAFSDAALLGWDFQAD